MDYTVDPGLYAVGNPNADSHVLVSANYKLSFDSLRKWLSGGNLWILVLDTKGVNVWCAAGKGTFGTRELVERVNSSRLAQVVSHRKLILPQLAGPGVAAHEVKKQSGFKVVYGPIEAKDLPKFIDSGLKAAPAMRRKSFNFVDRLVLIPVELKDVLKFSAILLPLFFLAGGLGGPGAYWANALNHGLFAVCALLSGVLAGAVLTPILLPWIPGRAFAAKGLWVGLLAVVVLALFRANGFDTWSGRLEIAAWLCIVPAIAAYLAMNFTGASTYTSLSGVRKEMRIAAPLQISAAVIGIGCWISSRLIA
jgi:acetyl-CoA decarbonylase/synthase complex subunit gamma